MSACRQVQRSERGEHRRGGRAPVRCPAGTTSTTGAGSSTGAAAGEGSPRVAAIRARRGPHQVRRSGSVISNANSGSRRPAVQTFPNLLETVRAVTRCRVAARTKEALPI